MSNIAWASSVAKSRAYENGITDAVAAKVIRNNGPLNANGRVGVAEINEWLAEGWVTDKDIKIDYYMSKIRDSRILICFFFVAVLVILDLYIKYIFRNNLFDTSLFYVFIENYLYIDKIVFNKGFSWSGFDYSEASSFFYYFLTTVGIISFTIFILYGGLIQSLVSVFVVSGLLGNTIDKIYFGKVTDFITLFNPDTGKGIVFNLADLFVFLPFTLFAFLVPHICVKLFYLIMVLLLWTGTVGFMFYDIDLENTVQGIFS